MPLNDHAKLGIGACQNQSKSDYHVSPTRLLNGGFLIFYKHDAPLGLHTNGTK